MTSDRLDRYLAQYPSAAVCVYAAAVLGLLCAVGFAVADIYEKRSALTASTGLLAQLEARRPAPGMPAAAAGPAPAGSPFLEGQTITVAGASLLQRVAAAVTQVGGSVQSSQVDLQGAQSKNGFVTLLVSCEVEQSNLQTLLYDLEAGMPYLFVAQLVVQAPQTASLTEGARMRVLLAVSGQWQGAK